MLLYDSSGPPTCERAGLSQWALYHPVIFLSWRTEWAKQTSATKVLMCLLPTANWMMSIQAMSHAKLKQKLVQRIAAWVTDKFSALWGWITCCGYRQWLWWIRIREWGQTARKDFVPFKPVSFGGASDLEDRLCHVWISGEDGFRWLHLAHRDQCVTCWPHVICWSHWRIGEPESLTLEPLGLWCRCAH